MGRLPTNFEFGEYLSHTFPGFFSAVTFFMLLDILSHQNLTAWAIKDISGLISFTAFILLAGTIFGVILDGIRHSLIESLVFINIPGIKKISDNLKYMIPGDNLELSNFYFFKLMGDTPSDAQCAIDILIKNVYRYVEFYGNVSMSLLMFSFVVPFYLYQVLYVPWSYSFLLAILSMIIAGICFYSSYKALKDYKVDRFSQICGYLDQKVELSVESIKDTYKDPNNSNNLHLFSWSEITGKDNEKLIKFLKDKLKIEWVKTEDISKNDGGKTIIVSNNDKSLSLKLNDEKTKVNLKIENGEAYEFTVRTENDKLNIYSNNYKIIATIVDKKCLNQVVKKNIRIYFRVYHFSGSLCTNIYSQETISNGKATYKLFLNNKDEVIVSSENCIPAVMIIPEE